MKKVHVLTLAAAIGLSSSSLLAPLAFAEGLVEGGGEELQTLSDERSGGSESSDIEAQPLDAPACFAILQQFDGQTIRFGGYSSKWGVISTLFSARAERDYACMGEMYNSEISFGVSEAETDNENVRQYYLSGAKYEYNEEMEWWDLAALYESDRITVTFERDESEENAAVSSNFQMDLYDKYSTFMIESEELVEFNANGYDNFYPTNLAGVRELLEEYPSVTLEEGPIKAEYACRYDTYDYDGDGEDEVTFEVFYYVPYYVNGYYYGRVGMYIAYEAIEMESENGEPVTAQVANEDAEQFADDTVFIAKKVEEVATAGSDTPVEVIREDEKLVIVYDLSLASESEGVKYTQFNYGVVVEMDVDQSLIDMSMPIYARFVDANGNTPDADVPVMLDCDNGYGPMSISDSSAVYCRLSFVAPHFSQYAMVQTFNPLVLLEEVEAPDTGAAPAENSVEAGSFVPMMALATLAGTGVVARRKNGRK